MLDLFALPLLPTYPLPPSTIPSVAVSALCILHLAIAVSFRQQRYSRGLV